MRAIKLTIFAVAATLSLGIAHAGEADMEVVVAVAQRPISIEIDNAIVAPPTLPSIDFTRMMIEAPSLDRLDTAVEPPRTAVALADETESKS